MSAAAIMMLAFLLSRLTGLVRTVAIGYRFGTGPELDAYLAANRLSDTLFQVTVGGAVASAFIPVLASFLARDDRAGAWRLVSALLTLAVVAVAPLSLLLALFAPELMRLAGGFPEDQRLLAGDLLRILLLSPVLFALGTFATSTLNAYGRFLLTALAPSLYNAGIVFGALLLSGPLGIHGLAWGASLGALLYLLVQLPGLASLRLRYRPRLGLDDPAVRRVGALMAPRSVGLAVSQLNFLAIVALASPIPGAITALEYAWTLAMLPLGLFAMAIATAVFPTLAAQTADRRDGAMAETMGQSLRAILYLTLPAALGLAMLAHPIVQVLLERGEFGPASTAMTVAALRFYALGLVGQALTEIVTRAFYALQDTRTPVLVGLAAMALNLALGLMLRPSLGHGGLALALSLASLAEAAVLYLLVRRRLSLGPLAVAAARCLGGTAALAVALYVVLWVSDRAVVDGVARLVVALVLGGALYLGVTAALGAQEPARLLRVVRQRVSPAPRTPAA